MGTPEKMLKMQMQIRENAVELNDYLRDLDTWECDIKKQDNTFSKMKPKQEKQLLAPIRSNKTTKTKEPVKAEMGEKPKRIRSYDFKSWDKLDVDKMLDDIDNKEEEKEAAEYAQKQELLEEDMKKCSEEEKIKGNDHFKASRYEKAIECYTKGMQYDPTNPILPANRAMAYLKVKKYVESEADCTLSLSLDPTYVKAYLRRGSARNALGKIESAIRDFSDVLKLESDNRQAKTELENIKKRNSTPKATNVKDDHQSATKKPGLVQPIKKPLHLQSKKPLRRIHIEEVGGEEKRRHPTELTESTSASGEDGMEQERVPNLHAPPIPNGCPPPCRTEPRSTVRNSRENKHNKMLSPDVDSDCSKPDVTSPLSTTIPPPPSTCFQLQADIRKLKRHPDAMFEYLSQLTPSSLPSLLKDQLDTDLLLDMAAALATSVAGNEEFITDFLRHLSLARRFDMATMFLSTKNKKDLKDLFENLLQNHSSQSSTIEKLMSTYGL